MQLVKEFLVKDIIAYELTENVNILEELNNYEMFIVQDLIKIGNKCSDEEAENILNRALQEKDLTEIINELVVSLVGKELKENEEAVDTKEYKNFSDILEDFYTQMQVADGLSIDNFMNMSTKFMYRYADGIQKRYIQKINNEMQSQYNSVAMFMSALAGKLKECPKLDEDGSLHKETLEEKIAKLKRR